MEVYTRQHQPSWVTQSEQLVQLSLKHKLHTTKKRLHLLLPTIQMALHSHFIHKLQLRPFLTLQAQLGGFQLGLAQLQVGQDHLLESLYRLQLIVISKLWVERHFMEQVHLLRL